MNSYAPLRFRPAFGLAAVALTAATMSLAIGVPAALSPDHAVAPATASAAIEVTIVPASIDVIGLRGESVASTPARRASRS